VDEAADGRREHRHLLIHAGRLIMGGRMPADGNDITGRLLDHLMWLGVGYVPQVDDVFDPLKVSESRRTGMDDVLVIFLPLRSRLNRCVSTMSGRRVEEAKVKQS
jgi:ABC-type branched-subunit amino acid transport system ATPase component